jgi:hypothetical protein
MLSLISQKEGKEERKGWECRKPKKQLPSKKTPYDCTIIPGPCVSFLI